MKMRPGAVRISILVVSLFSFFAAVAQTDEEKQKVTELMKFMEFTLNTLGNPEVAVNDKNTIIDQSYLKIYTSANVQVEDDLTKRQVSINKGIQAYLKDVDILFKDIKFKFDINNIEKLTSSGQQEYFKVTYNSTITGITSDDKAYDNSTVRYAEVNYDAAQQIYKVASIYSSGIRDLKAFQSWWEALDFEWKVVFQRAIGTNVNLNEPHKVLGIKEIDISYNKYITNLHPLSQIAGLEVLNISSTNVSDISTLSGLANLRELYMSNTNVLTLEPLKELKNLKIVFFENTSIESLASLEAMKSLKKVVVINTPIDLGEIKKFEETHPSCEVVYETTDLVNWWKNLPLAWKESFKEQFSIASTPTGEDLARIKSSETINLEGKTGILSLAPIADFKNVKVLVLKKSGVRSLEPLKGFTNLERLDLSDTHIDSLGPVKKMELKLLVADYSNVSHQELTAYKNTHPSATVIFKTMDYTIWWIKLSEEWRNILAKQVGYTGPIDKLPLKYLYDILELEELVIPEGSSIEDITPLTNLKELREIKMSRVMKISNLAPLSGLAKLEKLDCSYNPVADLTPLSNLKNLRELNIEYTRVSDLDPLATVTSIRVLSVSGTKISNINTVRSLDKLVEIYLQNTSVSNLSPLYTLVNLSKVSCFNAKVSQKDVDKFKSAKPACEVVYY
ncbi:Leucine-rich repeat protein [Fulvivirga imtechensis AK7]|uniref:Leucine-rich repeat protein n=2 Tax=Fulvivirga TaxID=396811 RepID=L8JJ26_9BACT|nr:Leucine-rich repeat protein [Fulvivirga imtechensis AK7]